MKRVAIIGTQGVPARYGGFETLVENIIGENCSADVEYTVFCSGKDMHERKANYRGAQLRYVGLRANGMQSIPYDMLSMCRALRGFDTLLILGTSGCLFLPVVKAFSKAKIIVNIDGLEHRRAKWGKVARTILRWSEWVACHMANIIIADNKAIGDYVLVTHGRDAEIIAYGGDHVAQSMSAEAEQLVMQRYDVTPGAYAVTVCRIEPENNCHRILEAFAKADERLLFIGNWHHSDYARTLRHKYAGHKNITMADPEYDLPTLFALRKNARHYIHGHSAGGTNPSLVEAMFFGNPILCFDVNYNRETTFGQAAYWRDAKELQALLQREDMDGAQLAQLARKEYTWREISRRYEELY